MPALRRVGGEGTLKFKVDVDPQSFILGLVDQFISADNQ